MIDIFPAIDLIGGRCVRLERGDYDKEIRYEVDPIDKTIEYVRLGARRIHIVDLEGAREGKGVNREVVGRIAHRSTVPIQLGGGIRTGEDVCEVIDLGVNYLIIGTVALTNPELVTEWVKRWGGDRFILSLDVGGDKLRTAGWRETANCTLEEAIARAKDWRIQQIICTDIEKDGSLEQPGYQTLAAVRSHLQPDVKLVAAGGVSRPEQLWRLQEVGVNAAIVGRALYDGEFTLEEFLRAG